MDEAAFQKELSKYKVVRRADSYKIRWNKLKAKKTIEAPTPAPVPVAPQRETPQTEGLKFWELLNTSPRNGLTTHEWAKFVESMKMSHMKIADLLNLEDLEALAAIAH